MQKLIYLAINMLMVLLLLTSCMTQKLWKKNEYPEVFQQYLISGDQDKIVVIGEKYNYIYTIDTAMRNILNWQNKNILNIDIYKANIAKDGTVTGSYNISVLYNKLSPEQREWLKNNEFQFSTLKKENLLYLYYKSKLSGQRELANRTYLSSKMFPLHFQKNNAIGIREDFSGWEKAPRLLASPITMAMDGTFIITMIILDGFAHAPIGTLPVYKK